MSYIDNCNPRVSPYANFRGRYNKHGEFMRLRGKFLFVFKENGTKKINEFCQEFKTKFYITWTYEEAQKVIDYMKKCIESGKLDE